MSEERDPGDEDDLIARSDIMRALGLAEGVGGTGSADSMIIGRSAIASAFVVFPDTQMIAEALARGTLGESHAVSIGSAVAIPRDTIGWPGPPDKDEP